MSEATVNETVSEETATLDESADVAETTEETPVAPNLDELPAALKMIANAMFASAKAAREEYVKIYNTLDAQGDPDKVVEAARAKTENVDAKAILATVAELQAQIDAKLADVDTILRDADEINVPSEAEMAEMRTNLGLHKKAFNDALDYAEEHIVEGFALHFDALPGARGRRKYGQAAASEGSTSERNVTTGIKPKIANAFVNGARAVSANGNSTFSAAAILLKKESGKHVDVGDLHKQWLSAAGKENPSDVEDDVVFGFTPNGSEKEYTVKIEVS